jgi:hypothetical protein
MSDRKTATPFLRADVQSAVDALIRSAPRSTEIHRWRHYSEAKQVINRICGWGCTNGGFDQREYDNGIQAYLRGVNL